MNYKLRDWVYLDKDIGDALYQLYYEDGNYRVLNKDKNQCYPYDVDLNGRGNATK